MAGTVGAGVGVVWVVLISLPHVIATFISLDLGGLDWGWLAWAVALWVPPFLLLFSAAKKLGGRWWLGATFLLTLPTLTVLWSATALFAPYSIASALLIGTFILLAAVAVLSSIVAVFYEPLKTLWHRWRQDQR
jgi:hypothetical protein